MNLAQHLKTSLGECAVFLFVVGRVAGLAGRAGRAGRADPGLSADPAGLVHSVRSRRVRRRARHLHIARRPARRPHAARLPVSRRYRVATSRTRSRVHLRARRVHPPRARRRRVHLAGRRASARAPHSAGRTARRAATLNPSVHHRVKSRPAANPYIERSDSV